MNGEGIGRQLDWEFGVSKCKLLHFEWSYYKAQYPVINYDGLEHKKNVYVYNWVTLLYSRDNNINQLYSNLKKEW